MTGKGGFASRHQGGRERERARHPFLLQCVPLPLELGPLSILLIIVPMCLAAVREDEGARGERAFSAGEKTKLIVLSSAVWSGPGHEGEERGKGERRGGGRVGKAAEVQLHLLDSLMVR